MAYNNVKSNTAGITIVNTTGEQIFDVGSELAAVEGLGTTGITVRSAADTWLTRTITGGTGITVNNGDGVAGAPDVVLDTPVSVANGGSGAITLTDGGILLGSGVGAITATAQPASGNLLIGSVGADPVLGTLTAPAAGVTITEGAGTITFALADDLSAVEGLATTGIALRTGASTWSTDTYTDTTSFTPAFAPTGGASSFTYTTQVGFYAVLGPVVFFQLTLLLSAFSVDTGTGNLKITGLPLTVLNNFANPAYPLIINNVDIDASALWVQAMSTENTTEIQFLESYDDAGWAFLQIADLNATSAVRIGGHYFT